MESHDLPLEVLCGQLIVAGFPGPDLTPTLARALARGERGGVILFRRNAPTLEAVGAACDRIARTAVATMPPWVGIDEEGGRVQRLPPPAIALPAMRTLASYREDGLVVEAGEVLGAQLQALGITIDFAPVLDVDTNPANPIIGDRAFGTTPDRATTGALAFYRGLSKHVLGCGKHFPGHGDTDVDSHLALPVLRHDRDRLNAVELAPFRAAALAGIDALMTAHLVATALDPTQAATMSSLVCTELLRTVLGFRGVLFSDDLEMKAVAGAMSYRESAVAAIRAGCDVLLICSQEDAQADAHDALIRAAESDALFRRRCVQALDRALAARRKRPPQPAGREAVHEAFHGRRVDSLAARLRMHESPTP